MTMAPRAAPPRLTEKNVSGRNNHIGAVRLNRMNMWAFGALACSCEQEANERRAPYPRDARKYFRVPRLTTPVALLLLACQGGRERPSPADYVRPAHTTEPDGPDGSI